MHTKARTKQGKVQGERTVPGKPPTTKPRKQKHFTEIQKNTEKNIMKFAERRSFSKTPETFHTYNNKKKKCVVIGEGKLNDPKLRASSSTKSGHLQQDGFIN